MLGLPCAESSLAKVLIRPTGNASGGMGNFVPWQRLFKGAGVVPLGPSSAGFKPLIKRWPALPDSLVRPFGEVLKQVTVTPQTVIR